MPDDAAAAAPKNRDALAAHFEDLGVREGTYHLFGAHLDDAMVMDKRPQGWVVFYSERGGEHSLAVYESETDACTEILDRVTREEHVFFELVAGPAPAAEADEAFEAWLNRHGTTLRDIDSSDWKTDDVPWAAGPYWRRYFVRIKAARRLAATS